MAENYKHLYEQTKKMLTMYQDEVVPGLRMQITEIEIENERLRDMWAEAVSKGSKADSQIPRWIPVSERLPEHFGTFLVAIDEVHGENRVSVDSADFDPYEKSWKTFNYFCAGFKITHWMPLPEPPKED